MEIHPGHVDKAYLGYALVIGTVIGERMLAHQELWVILLLCLLFFGMGADG